MAGRERRIGDVVGAARRRLSRLAIEGAARKHALFVVAAAGLGGASRAWVWPLDGASPWRAVARATILAVGAASVVLGVVIVRAWRRRPSALAAARRIDEALGLEEVVASGFAFERDGADGEVALLAVDRAHGAIADVDFERVLVARDALPSPSARRRLVAVSIAALLGLTLGTVDRRVVERVLHPVTAREANAAARLDQAALAATEAASEPEMKQLVEAARRASAAAKKGDRARAREALDDVRRAAQAISVEQREQAQALRALREGLAADAARPNADTGAKADEAAGAPPPSGTASEALARMRRSLEGPTRAEPHALKELAERLQKAEATARSAAEQARAGAEHDGARSRGTDGRQRAATAWSEAEAAMREAREAAARGDAEAAKRALERAEKAISAIEGTRARMSSRQLARLGDQASSLDRSMSAASEGAGGEPGEDDDDADAGGGNASADGAEGAPGSQGKSGNGDRVDDAPPTGAPGDGPGRSAHEAGPEQRRIKVAGDLQARADVGAGERAVHAIEGMGRGGDPQGYREVFPSYDTVVEDGLREELVPAARRAAVRRYFSLIRPGDAPESRK